MWGLDCEPVHQATHWVLRFNEAQHTAKLFMCRSAVEGPAIPNRSGMTVETCNVVLVTVFPVYSVVFPTEV